MNNNLEYKKIKTIKRVKKKQKVYNFNVPGYESYVANGFVVHNCENFSISQRSILDNSQVLSPEEIINISIENNCKSISMSYNEPTISFEYLIELANYSKSKGIPFVLKTNAFINKEPWREVCRVTDAINIDWKGSEEKFKFITGSDSYVLQDRIKEAYYSGTHIEISVPLYYEKEDINDEINILGNFLYSIDKNIPCHLLRISPSYKYDEFIFNSENMKEAKKVLSNYMNNIYVVV